MVKLTIVGEFKFKEKDWFQHFILNNCGVASEEVIYNQPAIDKIPELILGAKKISKDHGHIKLDHNSVTTYTYPPYSCMKNYNFLPLIIQEIRNLLRAAANPKLLDLPVVHKGYLDERDADMVFDLEWNVGTGQLTAVGVAYEKTCAYSTHNIEECSYIVSSIREGSSSVVGGHNIIDADLPLLGFDPKEIRDLVGRIIDTMIAAHLVHPHFAELGLYSLEDMCKFYDPMSNWKESSLERSLLDRNGLDCARNFGLMQHLRRDIEYTKQSHLLPKDQKLAAMALAMKQRGVKIDVEALETYARQRKQERESLTASFPFNPNSPKQIKTWASTRGIKLKNSQYETIKKFEGKDEEFDKLVRYREDSKALSTWFPVEEDDEGIIHCTTDLIHPEYKVCGTSVARPSCANPNMLNIPEGGPRQMEDGKTRQMPNLRRFFVPRDKDLCLLSFDFSSIEHTILGYLAGDKEKLDDLLVKRIKTYRRVAAEYYGKRYEEVTHDEYRFFKTIVLATDYCESPTSLSGRLFGRRDAKSLSISRNIQSAYFRTYPKTRQYQQRIAAQLDSGDLSLRNPFGRLRKVYAQDSHERQKRGVHYMGCSTSADLVNQKALDIWAELGLVPFEWCYDELCYEVESGMAMIGLAQRIEEILLSPTKELNGLVIPLTRKFGPNYGTMKEFEL